MEHFGLCIQTRFQFFGKLWSYGQSFYAKAAKLDETVERMVELAAMSRKDGMMALEGQPVPDSFLKGHANACGWC